MMRLCLFAYDVSRLRGLVKEVGSVFKEPTETQSGYPTTLPSFKGASASKMCVSAIPAGAGTPWRESVSRSNPARPWVSSARPARAKAPSAA